MELFLNLNIDLPNVFLGKTAALLYFNAAPV